MKKHPCEDAFCGLMRNCQYQNEAWEINGMKYRGNEGSCTYALQINGKYKIFCQNCSGYEKNM